MSTRSPFTRPVLLGVPILCFPSLCGAQIPSTGSRAQTTQVTIASPLPDSVPTAPPPNAIKVPFELRDGRIYVQLKLNDKKTIDALVDTCSAGTLLPSDVGKALKLPAAATMDAVNPSGKRGKVTAIELPQV